MYNQPQSAVPPDKIVQQMIVQAIQAFYIQDYDTGLYFLNQIKANLPRYMYQISPSNKTLCKEIVKLLQDGSMVPDRSTQSAGESAATSHPGLSGITSGYDQQSVSAEEQEQPHEFVAPEEIVPPESSFLPVEEETPSGTVPTEFISELSSAVATVRDKKKKKVSEKLTGSMDELEDFDF